MKHRRTAHTVYQLAYHFVWIPKFREPILRQGIDRRLKEMIQEICTDYEWGIEAIEVMEDHVHLFVSCPPRYAPAEVMNIIKSLTARLLYQEFPRLRKIQRRGRLWADGYYVGSSGEQVTSELIQKYIRYQKTEATSSKQLNLFGGTSSNQGRAIRK